MDNKHTVDYDIGDIVIGISERSCPLREMRHSILAGRDRPDLVGTIHTVDWLGETPFGFSVKLVGLDGSFCPGCWRKIQSCSEEFKSQLEAIKVMV